MNTSFNAWSNLKLSLLKIIGNLMGTDILDFGLIYPFDSCSKGQKNFRGQYIAMHGPNRVKLYLGKI